MPSQIVQDEDHEGVGGVSSFGYSGTIAHVVLSGNAALDVPAASVQCFAAAPLKYRRRAFLWRDPPHPFAQRRLPCASAACVFRSPADGLLRALVADHAVQGRVIFPGAGYLEMARAATSGSTLNSVFFLQPLVVEVDGLQIECVITDDGVFQVRSGEGDGAWEEATVHCSGALTASVSWHHSDHAPARACVCGRAATAARNSRCRR